MTAIIHTYEDREALLIEYVQALQDWTRARSLNPLWDRAPEVVAAGRRLEKVEEALRDLGQGEGAEAAFG